MDLLSRMKSSMQQHKQSIIEHWLDEIEREFPEKHDRETLRTNGNVYFEILLDMEIPLEEHPFYELIPNMCRYHADRGTPISHLLHSSHIWRRSTIDRLSSQPDVLLDRSSITQLHERIDEVQRHICEIYWGFAKEQLEQRDQQIQELHHDRLNLIGKMAASLAHELRNPLTSIGGFMKLIRSKLSQESEEKTAKYFDVIEKEFASFQLQITGFLSFSQKREQGEPFIAMTGRELINSVLSLIEPRFINENIELQVNIRGNSRVYGQKMALQQVMINLLNNSADALMDSTRETKSIRIQLKESGAYTQLCIANNGPRIPDRIQQSLFTPFVTSKADGTGLGLTICRKIMEQNQGSITFHSTDDETSFTLQLPVPPLS
jgi:two-component system, sporulation sensor kinase D